jgi:raffinose/stachyose/melibiose transport system substrate-binding protein
MARLRKRILTVFAVAALSMAGCSAASSSGDADWASTDPHDASGEVTVWAWGDNQDIADGIAARFMEVYPDIDLTFRVVAYSDYVKTLSAALASGKGPDAYNLGPDMVPQFGPLSEDLGPLAESVLGEDWRDQLVPSMVEEVSIGDKLVGGPGQANGAGTVIVNQRLLDELGLEWPSDVTSIDDLAGFCDQVRAGGKGCIGIGAKDEWVSQDVLQAIANSIEPGVYAKAVAGETPWTDPTLVEAFDLWQRLFTDGIVQDGALAMPMYPDVDQAWQRGEYVAQAMGTWIAMNFVTDNTMQYQSGAGVSDPTPLESTVEPFPAVGGGDVHVFASVAWGTAINQNSANKAAAAAWVNWYSLDREGEQKHAADTLVGTPALRGVEIEPAGLAHPDLVQPSIDYLTEELGAVTEKRSILYPELVTALGLALQQSASGTDSEQVTEQLEAASAAVQR